MKKELEDEMELVNLYLEKQDAVTESQVIPQLKKINENLEKIIRLLARAQASPS